MKAILCNEFGLLNTLEYQEVKISQPKEREILV